MWKCYPNPSWRINVILNQLTTPPVWSALSVRVRYLTCEVMTEFVLFVQVCTEGRLILEFAFDDLMRIKTWHFNIRQYRELIPRSILAMHVSVTSLACDLYLKKKNKCNFLNPASTSSVCKGSVWRLFTSV